MNKAKRINEIISKVGANTYLEIGYGRGANFFLVKCRHKIAVDPDLKEAGIGLHKMTSDKFFDSIDGDFDVVFIDGLHTCEQVRKDIINACRRNAKAVILHDTIPPSKRAQEVPRVQSQWTGDVWRASVGLGTWVEIETYVSDYGLTVFYPDGIQIDGEFEDKEMTYEYFEANKVELLNIIGD